MVKKSIVKAIQAYLDVLPSVGIHASRAVLFGSFARGDSGKWSDIDLIVIAPEFDAPPERALIRKLWEATLHADVRIEPIPCGEREWDTNEGRTILDVARQEGVVIAGREAIAR